MLTGTNCHLTMIGISLCWLEQAGACLPACLPARPPGHSHGSIQSHICPTSPKSKIIISDMAGPMPVPACTPACLPAFVCTEAN